MNGEKAEVQSHPEGCRCPMCMWGHSGMRHRKHLLVKIVILVLVFGFGYAVGVHRGEHRGFHGYYGNAGMMQGGYGRQGMMGGRGGNVMYRVNSGTGLPGDTGPNQVYFDQAVSATPGVNVQTTQ